jgi:hypothetical protein
VVKHVPAANVTLLDQSPHQLEKAKAKAPLRDVTIVEVHPPTNYGAALTHHLPFCLACLLHLLCDLSLTTGP